MIGPGSGWLGDTEPDVDVVIIFEGHVRYGFKRYVIFAVVLHAIDGIRGNRNGGVKESSVTTYVLSGIEFCTPDSRSDVRCE